MAIDLCPGTVIPQARVPSVKLGANCWALVDGDGVFDTQAPKGRGPGSSYSIGDTGGCSCEQIIDTLGLGSWARVSFHLYSDLRVAVFFSGMSGVAANQK
jgi:hypothetical protein